MRGCGRFTPLGELTAASSGVILSESRPQLTRTGDTVPFLDVPDAFQIEVPDGWEASDVSPGEYALTPGDDSGLRINIVVYGPRPKLESLADASTAAVRAWAKNIGVPDSESLTVLTPGGETPRAFAAIHGDQRDVYVGFFYFKRSFVVAAGSAPAGDRPGLTRVERLLWSIEAA
jgi:hypothetical protein